MPAAVIALVGALVFGAADFLGGLAAKRVRAIVTTAVAAASGLVLLLVLYPVAGGVWHPSDVVWGAVSGIFGAVAIALLYACLATGPMSILSPLTAIVSAVAPMLWGLIVKGEQVGAVGYAGLGVALVAVVLVGFVPGDKVVRPSLRGIAMAIGAGLSISGFMIIMDDTTHDSGIVPLMLNRSVNGAITAFVVFVLIMAARRRGTPARMALAAQGVRVGATPTGFADLERAEPVAVVGPSATIPASAWWFAIACGALDATANVLLLLALRLGDLSIVAALAAMYPAGTIALAALVLRERVAWVQWIGLALALAAGALLAVA